MSEAESFNCGRKSKAKRKKKKGGTQCVCVCVCGGENNEEEKQNNGKFQTFRTIKNVIPTFSKTISFSPTPYLSVNLETSIFFFVFFLALTNLKMKEYIQPEIDGPN